ncbi:MAG: FISUMP domain-containing protein [Bacteroidota bacterium]|nr:FISUMP domain-containing protein [Bacteroidota bacterium]
MKKIFTLMLFFIISCDLTAQTVFGILVDNNGSALGGISLNLYVSQKVYSATSLPNGSFTFTNITAVKEEQLPAGYSISANFPNPFNPRTRIEITLPNNGNVKAELFNQIGQKIGTDIEKNFSAGKSYIDLELNGLSNGFYIAQITVDGKYKIVRKLMLLYGSQHLITSSSSSNTGMNKTDPLGNTSIGILLDSIVASSAVIGRKTFTSLPLLTGSELNLGNLVVERFCPGIPTVVYAGKTYNTIQIGSQCWLKENLDVGVRINGATEQTNNIILEKYCFNDVDANCTTYGGLYQWDEAMQYGTAPGLKGICPTDWHIPTIAEYETLGATLNNDGDALKAVGEGTGTGAGTNTSGFSALLAGFRYYTGAFELLGRTTVYWSSTMYSATNASEMILYNQDNRITMYNGHKGDGLSIRCLKN